MRGAEMDYSAAAHFNGDPDKAIGLAESALTAIGFQITERAAGSADFEGPGMNSTRQSALVGASRIHVRGSRSEIALEAELGGVARMERFVTLFPVALCAFLAVLLTVLFSVLFGPGPWVYGVAAVTGALALLWCVLGPVMARVIRARTCRALDALLANMVFVGE